MSSDHDASTGVDPLPCVGARRLAASETLTVYRIVSGADRESAGFHGSFVSNAEKGQQPRRREKTCPPRHRAISTWTTVDQACLILRAFPKLGDRLAAVHLTPEVGVWVKTREDEPGHVIVWGDPHALTDAVDATVTCQV